MRSEGRKKRHKQLVKLIETNPLLTDEEISSALGVSLSTVRLDRGLLAIPELRERTRLMAEHATSRLKSLRAEEVVGELIGLEPNNWALSTLLPTPDMAFRTTELVGDYYIYAQAASLAIATIDAEMVVVEAARLKFCGPSYLGEKIIARSKAGTHKDNRYVVSVHSRIGEREIFVGRFVVAVVDAYDSEKVEDGTC
ncbi:MAG: transcription factor FapR [Synergistes jonesii]|uniref:transcription factor FapR n=1 Tax=Synergistes jonesii TaxID=2754 RepID=UPI002A74B1D2|nr:transcription factor FapR [Synergistes jonesii]MDY2985799.1 transcription factor FapR [Synergistes jonesii]